MGTRVVPSSTDPVEVRIQETVPYQLWYCPRFPIAKIGGKLDKDPAEIPWIQGLYEDIKADPVLRNPVIIWNHHANRLTGKQPEWLLRAGSNRIWCVEQLGWPLVPAIVSTAGDPLPFPCIGTPIAPREIESYFNDPGVIWANDAGFGLLAAARPEETYAAFTESDLPATHRYGRAAFPNIRTVLDE